MCIRDRGASPDAEVPSLNRRIEAASLAWGLTDREQQVLTEFARGRSFERISQTLFISRTTVKTHLRRIYVKADVHDRQQLLDALDDLAL